MENNCGQRQSHKTYLYSSFDAHFATGTSRNTNHDFWLPCPADPDTMWLEVGSK